MGAQSNSTEQLAASGEEPANPDARPRAAIPFEGLERLAILVENFEADAAIAELDKLSACSYSGEIDASLQRIYKMLRRFDYTGSAAETQKLLRMAQVGVSGEKPAAKKKILAVDDRPDVLNTVKAVLRDRYAVYAVTNHEAALKFLSGNKCDLILLDIEMPDMDGFSLLEIIRKMPGYRSTPVLFLTGNVSVENIKHSVSSGGNDFIKKPVDAQILLAKVGRHLAN